LHRPTLEEVEAMRIACVLGHGFEDSEFRVPYDKLKAAGHDVIVIGAKKGEKLEGKKGKETVEADAGIDESRPESYGALLIPGGHSPDHLRGDDRFVSFVRAFADKPVMAICHGPQLLLTADLVRGRTLTAWKTVQVDLRHAGANVVDREVCVDRNLVTSRKPEDLDAFVRESLRLLSNGASAHAR
jgi:protease I